jgi:hypothetical protein
VKQTSTQVLILISRKHESGEPHEDSNAAAVHCLDLPWKLIPAQAKMVKGPELYNLIADLSETMSLSEKMPDKVKELTELLKRVREKGISH